ncbi:MAG: hypothetical protein EDM72_15380 [Chlorobiota bacterium]|nr:MAG: hypothetical protein EDM72_15380 [Chlorobiota bacterium]
MHSDFKTTGEILETSIFLYQFIWIVIGALLVSGKKLQKRIGVIFLIIYILIGIGFSILSIIWFLSSD